jgi:UDP-GlcNAc:undecaprenyl-phosphate GlcNAc-1-phosphate transferase
MVFAGTFFGALGLSLSLTPLVRRLAERLRFYDYPNGHKVHARPTPLMGGLTIAWPVAIAVLAAPALLPSSWPPILTYGFLSGLAALVIVGLADDKNGMSPNVKLLAQLAAVTPFILAAGVTNLPFHPVLGLVLSYLWMVGLINAFNFLDNMDGITAGTAAVTGSFLAAIAYERGLPGAALLSMATVGSALGFLRFNFSPASIFLGDAGSMVIGYVLGAISLLTIQTPFIGAQTIVPLAAPVILLAYPVFDSTLVMVTRFRNGSALSRGGCDHSSHRMVALGYGKRRTVLGIYALTAMLGVLGVLTNQFSSAIFSTAVLLLVGTAFLWLGVRLSKAPVIEIEEEPAEKEEASRQPVPQLEIGAEEQVLAATRSRR